MKDEAPLAALLLGRQGVAGRLRYVAGRPAHVAKSSPIYPQGAVVEIKRNMVEGKEGKGGGRRPAIHRYLARRPNMASLNSHFHSSPHLAPLMLTPLTKSIRSKTKFPSSFSKDLFISF
jgi:hypothetical protein